MSLMRSLEIGRRGLSAQQAAISTAGQNIANLNTPGYARQRVGTVNTSVEDMPSGVDLVSIHQIRDQLLEARLHQESQDLSRWQSEGNWLRQVEALVMQDGDIPVNSALGRFWDSWHDLANDPTSNASRETVVQRAESVTLEVQTLHRQLTDVGRSINQKMRSSIGEVNVALENLGRLNRSITLAETDGQPANDLRDERYRLVGQLSEKLNVQTIEAPDGTFALNVSGIELVQGEQVSLLSTQETVQAGQPHILATWANGDPLPITSGELAGLAEVRDEILPDLLGQLNTMTQNLIQEVNSLHQTGYNPQHQTGLNFFSGTDSQNIQVAVTATQIATSAGLDSPADNTVALDIAQLRINGQVGETQQSYETYFADLVAQIGTVTQEASRFEENQTRLVSALQEQQQSTSGVSLDEEMTSLIQYQRSYEAAARYLSTVDELLQSVIGMAG